MKRSDLLPRRPKSGPIRTSFGDFWHETHVGRTGMRCEDAWPLSNTPTPWRFRLPTKPGRSDPRLPASYLLCLRSTDFPWSEKPSCQEDCSNRCPDKNSVSRSARYFWTYEIKNAKVEFLSSPKHNAKKNTTVSSELAMELKMNVKRSWVPNAARKKKQNPKTYSNVDSEGSVSSWSSGPTNERKWPKQHWEPP